MKLGKLAPRVDKRTIKLANILKVIPLVPPAYNVDKDMALEIPTPVFANDKWGDCVIAGRSHMSLRLECFEQEKILKISDKDVLREYWREQKAGCLQHPDNGLVMLDSLNSWRKGWVAAGQKYTIYAFLFNFIYRH